MLVVYLALAVDLVVCLYLLSAITDAPTFNIFDGPWDIGD